MTSRDEALRALEKAVELVAKATPGSWAQEHRRGSDSSYRTEVFDEHGGAIATLTWHAKPPSYENGLKTTSTDRAENAEAIVAAVNFIREHGSALIAELGQEVGAVADSELPGMWSASDFTGGDPDERCHAEREPVAAQEAFTAWFCLNYPGPHTIISDPNWHAPRIFRQAQWAIKQSSPAHTSEARDYQDAARYRFLIPSLYRDDFTVGEASIQLHTVGPCPTVDDVAAAIDAAMRQEGGNG